MMIAVVAAGLLLGQDKPTGGEIISKVMTRYQTGVKVQATIDSVVKSGATTITIKTNLQYDRPNKFYLQQQKTVQGPVDKDMPNKFRSALVVCDGSQVMYSDPNEQKRLGGKFSFEPASFLDGTAKDIDYLCVLSRGVLLERSIALDFLTGEMAALEEIAMFKIKSCTVTGQTMVDNQSVFVVEGDVDDYPLKGTYRLLADAQGNLYGMSASYVVGGVDGEGRPLPKTSVTMTHKVSATVGGPLDESKFTIPKGS